MNLLTIQLQAKNPSLKIARSYTIWLGQDLLGDWILTTVYGALGSRGATKTYAYSSQNQACQKLKAILKRRASAPRRIGCAYEFIYSEKDQSLFYSILKKLFKNIEQKLNPKRDEKTFK